MKRTIVAGLMMAAAVTPAGAQDTAEKVGIAAALGLTAGTGKTTLGDGAGGIEAALLNSDAIDHAGRIIAALTKGRVKGKVLILSRTDTVDLVSGTLVRDRIKALTTSLNAIDLDRNCAKAGTITIGPNVVPADALGESTRPKMKFDVSDITASVATDIAIGSVPINVDDRMLIQSVALNADVLPIKSKGSRDWQKMTDIEVASTDLERPFIIPGEVASGGADTIAAYAAMTKAADSRRHCAAERPKALVNAADTLAKSITDLPEGGGLSPLGRAILSETLAKKGTYILRVAAEEAGGTSIVSANIWYTLGFPDAATVSSGLLASFRLVDPATGEIHVAGFVRCATRPINIKHAQRIIDPQASRSGRTICAYRATHLFSPSPATPATGD